MAAADLSWATKHTENAGRSQRESSQLTIKINKLIWLALEIEKNDAKLKIQSHTKEKQHYFLKIQGWLRSFCCAKKPNSGASHIIIF